MTESRAPRVVLAGSVTSSRRTLHALTRHAVPMVGVLGLHPDAAANVSAYCDLGVDAQAQGLPFAHFRGINDPQTLAIVAAWRPTLLFVVGLSQLIQQPLMRLAPQGCIGFHPTRLPLGRGRAPLAWITLGAVPPAATFFLLDEGVDSGAIVAQEPFDLAPDDDAAAVGARLEAAIDRALDRWLPNLARGTWSPTPQDHAIASYFGIRRPADGIIDWTWPATRIERLIAAAAKPHPGAFSVYRDYRLRIWHAAVETTVAWCGVPGRVLAVAPGPRWLIAAGDGALWISQVVPEAPAGEPPPPPAEELLRVGVKLGYVADEELLRLRREILDLRNQVTHLTALIHHARDVQ